jgi:hypothetical protein
MADRPFKTCPCCRRAWPTRAAFIADPSVVLNGYQADFARLERGLLFFTHAVEECGSTTTIHAGEFLDLYQGPRHAVSRTLSPECPRHCISRHDLEPCGVKCECAFVREVVQLLRAGRDVGVGE